MDCGKTSLLRPEQRQWFLVDYNETLPIGVYDQENPPSPKVCVYEEELQGTIFTDDSIRPAEINYEKLFNSILFKLESEDRAKDSNDPNYRSPGDGIEPNSSIIKAGHVTLATDNEAYTHDNGDESLYSRVPRTGQLPVTEEAVNIQVGDNGFNINLIPTNPVDGIDVEKLIRQIIDPSGNNNQTTHYDVSLSDNQINWYKQAFDAIKAYIDTVMVYAGDLSANNTTEEGHTISIELTPADASSTNRFTVSANIVVDNDPTLPGSSNTIPSSLAVKTYVDSQLIQYVTLVDFNTLEGRVTVNENAITGLQSALAGKADLTDLANYLPLAGGALTGQVTTSETTFTGNQLITDAWLDTVLEDYYTQAEVDALLDVERARITTLENQVADLQGRVTALESAITAFLTKPDADLLYSPLGHTHPYHPVVSPTITDGTYPLERLSSITVQEGVVIAINN